MSHRVTLLIIGALCLTAGCNRYLPSVRAVADVQLRDSEAGAAAVVLDDQRLVKNEISGHTPVATEVVYRRLYIANRDGLSLANLQVYYGPQQNIDHLNGR